MMRGKSHQRGQALLEFALSMPILLFVILGLIDFGRVLFTYAQASNALRGAVRYAEILGYADATTRTYLDCPGMEKAAGEVYFAEAMALDIKYVKSDDMSVTYDCDTVTDAALSNGDMLQLTLTANVKLISLPFEDMVIDFEAQRTIVKTIEIGGPCPPGADPDDCDADYDGLRDGWEKDNLGGSIKPYNATDDPDGDGCNNGCEETRGTDPMAADGPSSPPPVVGGPGAPLAPQNFTATPDCTAGTVSFAWDPMSPIPTRALIKDKDTNATVVTIDDVDPGLITLSYCTNCDTITNGTGYRRYYMFAISGTAPNEVRGPDSNVDDASCATSPPAPINFVAAPDCSTGQVSFAWTWGTTTPYPTRAEIRNASTNAVVKNIADTSQTTCTNCDSIPIPTGSRNYYIVAFNGSGSTYVSPNSNTAMAACTATTYSGIITGYLWKDADPPGSTQPNGVYNATDGDSLIDLPNSAPYVNLRNSTGTINLNSETNNLGIYQFSNLPPGTYTLSVPASISSNGHWDVKVVRGGVNQNMITNNLDILLGTNVTLNLNFGYRK